MCINQKKTSKEYSYFNTVLFAKTRYSKRTLGSILLSTNQKIG